MVVECLRRSSVKDKEEFLKLNNISVYANFPKKTFAEFSIIPEDSLAYHSICPETYDQRFNSNCLLGNVPVLISQDEKVYCPECSRDKEGGHHLACRVQGTRHFTKV